MALNKRTAYGGDNFKQGEKSSSLEKSSIFVNEIIKIIEPLLGSCIYFTSEIKLGNAPAVVLSNGKRAIAPDILCTTKKGNRFWIEIKDKSQRFYHPDTGADLFQVYGWYNINKFYCEPVFVLFKDPPFEDCLPRFKVSDANIAAFKTRWNKFNGFPYGAWLSNCLIIKDFYPKIFLEKTRDQPMYILYFKIDSLKKIENFEELINQVDSNIIKNVESSFSALDGVNNQTLNEVEIRRLLASVFRD